MNLLKRACLVFLLIDLTLCIIFIPQLFNGQTEESLLNKTVVRSYTSGTRARLSGEQVARLYYNCEINVGYNMLPIRIGDEDHTSVIEDAIETLRLVFGAEKGEYAVMENLIDKSSISLYRNSIIVKIDDQPTALNFIMLECRKDDSYIEMVYEAKTKTLVRLSCSFLEKQFDADKDITGFQKSLESLSNRYYNDVLLMRDEEHYEFFVIYYICEKEESVFLDAAFSCGLCQMSSDPVEDYIIKAEMIKYTK